MVIIILSSFADKLFENKDYYRAITEYKREIFLGLDSSKGMKMIGECYKNLGEYDKALYWYGRLNFIDNRFESEYKYLLGITLNIEDLKLMLEEDETELKKIIERYEKASLKSYFSYLLPGSSQILFGKFREGVFSFFWNSITFYYFATQVKEKNYVGIILSFSLFMKFYTGNLEMAKRLEREDAYRKFKMELSEYFGY